MSSRHFERSPSRLSGLDSAEPQPGPTSTSSSKRMTLTVERHRFDKLVSAKNGLPPRVSHASASLAGSVYAFGGEVPQREPRSDTILLSDLWVYEQDKSAPCWRQIGPSSQDSEPWPEKRKGHTLLAVESRDCLLLFGGATTLGQASCRKAARRGGDVDEEGATGSDLIYYNDVWKFNRSNELWEELYIEGEKPLARAHHAAAIFGSDFMFVFGGYGCHEDAEIWVFDLSRLSWNKMTVAPECPEKPPRRFGHVSAVYNNCLYVFGGLTKSRHCDSAVWKFNTLDCTWRKLECASSAQHVPTSKAHSASAVMDCRWLIHGGSFANRSSGDFHEFNLKSEKWRNISVSFAPCPPLEMHQACIALDSPFIQSFVITGGSNSNTTHPQLISGGSRVDFLRPLNKQPLPTKLEDGYVSWLTKEVIVSLWNETSQFKSDREEFQRLKEFEKSTSEKLRNMDDIVFELEARLAEVTAECEDRAESEKAAKIREEELVHDAEDLRTDLREALDKQEEYWEELKALREMHSGLEHQNSKAQAERNKLHCTLEDAERELIDLRRDRDELALTLSTEQTAHGKTTAAFRASELKLQETEEGRGSLDNQMRRVADENNRLHQDLLRRENDWDAEREKLQHELASAQQKLGRCEESLVQLQSDLSGQRAAGDKNTREHDKEMLKLQQSLDNAQRSSLAKLEETEHMLQRRASEVAKLREEKNALHTQLATSKTAEQQATNKLLGVIDQIKGALADAEASKTQFERALAKEKAKAADAQSALAEAKAAAKKLERQHAESEKALRKCQADDDKKRQDIERLKAQLEQVEATLLDMRVELAKRQTQLNSLYKTSGESDDLLRRVYKAVRPLVDISAEVEARLHSQQDPECPTPSTIADNNS